VPASAYLDGQYGLSDVFVGVPVILGREGIEKILEIDLNAEEKEALAKSAADVKAGIADWRNIMQGTAALT
jgi:malate dehydrogenase